MAARIYRSTRAEGSLLWVWLGIQAAAPISEKLLFRGFAFRGFAHTKRDAIPSIVLVSPTLSSPHLQYAWFGMATIFVFGVLLELVRCATGSSTPTILFICCSTWKA